jgi:hypothetical protein
MDPGGPSVFTFGLAATVPFRAWRGMGALVAWVDLASVRNIGNLLKNASGKRNTPRMSTTELFFS